jgi:hypothetical protein
MDQGHESIFLEGMDKSITHSEYKTSFNRRIAMPVPKESAPLKKISPMRSL